jgi:Ribbon-helix-helix protein, copG family
MPTKNPRINISVDQPLYGLIQGLAEEEGVSLSMLARDLIKESLELREDAALAVFAEKREKSFDPTGALTHEQVWE